MLCKVEMRYWTIHFTNNLPHFRQGVKYLPNYRKLNLHWILKHQLNFQNESQYWKLQKKSKWWSNLANTLKTLKATLLIQGSYTTFTATFVQAMLVPSSLVPNMIVLYRVFQKSAPPNQKQEVCFTESYRKRL